MPSKSIGLGPRKAPGYRHYVNGSAATNSFDAKPYVRKQLKQSSSDVLSVRLPA